MTENMFNQSIPVPLLPRVMPFARTVVGIADRLGQVVGRVARSLINEHGKHSALPRAVRRDAFTPAPWIEHLSEAVRDRMLDAMPGWRFDQRSGAFVPRQHSPEIVEELLDAVTDLGADVVVLRVSGLSDDAAARVRRYLGTESRLITVSHLLCEPAAAHHPIVRANHSRND